MKNLQLVALLNALGTAVYVTIVAFIMQNGEKIFGKMNNLLGPVSFLLLFVFSAAITGALVLGRPVLMYLENKKADAIKLFLYTIGWLFVMIVAALGIQIVIK